MSDDPFGALVPWEPADAGRGDGPLAGLRIVVKDVIDITGSVTGGGNPDWAKAHEPAKESAAAVAALGSAGASLAGKGQCAELAFSLSGDNVHFGMPINAAAPDRDPGGSTSGPASAVAGGLCELGLGTDTLGSIRVPASYCGIYGFRPTHGRIPIDGVMPLAQSFDTIGLLAREPEQLRRAAGVLLERATDVSPPWRLLIAPALFAAADGEVAEATRISAGDLADRIGAELSETLLLDGAPSPAEAVAAFNVLQGVQVWRNYGDWVESTSPSLGPDIAARLERASGFGPADVEEAEPVAHAIADTLARLGPDEALVLPTTGTPAPGREAGAGERERARVSAGQLTSIATLAGAPAVSLPVVDAASPVGLSLVGAPGSDVSLLAAAGLKRRLLRFQDRGRARWEGEGLQEELAQEARRHQQDEDDRAQRATEGRQQHQQTDQKQAAEERPIVHGGPLGSEVHERERYEESAEPSSKSPARPWSKAGLVDFGDGECRTGRKGRDAWIQGEVPVDEDQAERSPAHHRGVGEVEVDPPEAERGDEARSGENPGFEAELESSDRGDDGGHGLAEHHDEELAEALGDVRDDDGRGTARCRAARTGPRPGPAPRG